MKRSTVTVVVIVILIIVAGVFLLARTTNAPGSTPSPSSSPTQTESSTTSSPSPTTGASATPAPTAAQGTTFNFTAAGFGSDPIKVTSGQTLTFVNKTSSTIQIDSDPHPQHTDNPELNVGQIAPGASKSVTPVRKGSFGIHNHLNPSQTGTVVVQ